MAGYLVVGTFLLPIYGARCCAGDISQLRKALKRQPRIFLPKVENSSDVVPFFSEVFQVCVCVCVCGCACACAWCFGANPLRTKPTKNKTRTPQRIADGHIAEFGIGAGLPEPLCSGGQRGGSQLHGGGLVRGRHSDGPGRSLGYGPSTLLSPRLLAPLHMNASHTVPFFCPSLSLSLNPFL